MRSKIGKTCEAVYAALDDIGPMSTAELMLFLDRKAAAMNDATRRLRMRKMVHITRWERQPDGHKGAMIPIYAAGDAEDAPKPKPLDVKQRNKRYRKRHAVAISIRRYGDARNSVGMWSGLL